MLQKHGVVMCARSWWRGGLGLLESLTVTRTHIHSHGYTRVHKHTHTQPHSGQTRKRAPRGLEEGQVEQHLTQLASISTEASLVSVRCPCTSLERLPLVPLLVQQGLRN